MEAAITGERPPIGHDRPEGEGNRCPNCGATRAGPFCQRCGQAAHIHHDLAGLGHDLAHGVFHFEGRFWNTLPLLVRRPGELTWRYVAGERAKFVTPMALFLFSVFLLFAAVNRLALPDVSGASSGLAKAGAEVDRAQGETRAALLALERERARRLATDAHADVRTLDERIRSDRQDLAVMGGVVRRLRPSDDAAAGHETATGVAWIDRPIHAFNENRPLYAYKLKMASYKFSWALIPISVPFIWLLFFWRRDFGLYHHAIFAIHSLSFTTLLLVGLIGLHLLRVPAGWLWFVFLATPPIHLFRHLRGAYRLGRWGALWRTGILLVFTALASSLFLLFLIWLETE
jgi:hypothetical protein